MPTVKQISFASMLVFALLSTASAQDSATVQRSSLTITAAASRERVRITAPASVVQMHVEVYAAGGEKLFDQEIRGGNVFDWHLQDGQAQRLAPGVYVCVVTTKSTSGRLTQKIGTVTVAENSASVQPAESPKLSVQQTQAIGPVEENSSWTIPGQEEPQTPTVIAHDGIDGQIIRGRGALTFRVGDFFSGHDQEQMRLTESGNLGIGTSEPKAKLDVAGTIRAERFLVAKPRLAKGDQAALDAQTTDAVDSVQPLIAGTGTLNHIAKWTPDGSTLGDSGIFETNGGLVGIGVASPTYRLVVGPDIGPGLTTSDLTISRGAGQSVSIYAGATGAHGMNFGWDEGNLRAFVNAPVQSPITFTHGGVNERMRIATNGNVGIGTNNPGAPLDVQVAAGQSLQFRQDSGLVPGINVKTTGGNAGIMRLRNSMEVWPSDDATRAGKVDVRDTTGFPTITLNGQPGNLSIIGTGQDVISGSSNAPGGTWFDLVNTGASGRTWNLISTSTGSSDGPGKFLIRDASAGVRGTFDTNGNFGIGLTGPLSRLHVTTDTGVTLRGNNTSSSSSNNDFKSNSAGIFQITNSGNNSVPLYADTLGNGTAIVGYGLSGGNGVLGNALGIGNGVVGISSGGYAGAFFGDIYVSGAITAGTKDFKIDHPLDPANKYLVHASIESSEVKNLYDGVVVLDSGGEAIVVLPDWFESLNRDFRYQLTCIGGSAQVYIAQEIANHRFKIAGGGPGMKVSWQVTGNRQDPFIKAHPMRVEEAKPEIERGFYIHPEFYGKPEEMGIEWARRPEQMRQMKEQREKLSLSKQ